MKRQVGNLLSRMFASGAAVALLLTIAEPAQSCTGIRVTAADGSVVYGRTLEFGVDLQSDVILVPRGYANVGTTPDGKPGKKWTARYASLGANALGLPDIFDGLNEKGLAVGTFYFPTMAKYQAYGPNDADKSIAPWELGSYLLENFATVDEVVANVSGVVVPDVVFPAWKFVPPAHYVVFDATGKSVVIEYVAGKLNIHENPLGIITNAPTFDWHMTNLRNYVNFSLSNVPPIKLGSVELLPFGEGSGMLGMPGDFTPPSRFVRAAAFSQSVLPSSTGKEAVLEVFHVLHNFDIPKGSTRQRQKDQFGNVIADYTLWTTANDLKAKRFYFHTYEDSQVRMVDLLKQNLDGKQILKWSMKGDEGLRELGSPEVSK